MRRAWLLWACAFFACGRELPNAVLTVEDPDGIATGAVTLGVGPDIDTLTEKDLGGRPFPITIALSTDRRRYEGEVWVEAYASDDTLLARGTSKAEIVEDNPSTVLIKLARPCRNDVDCDDGVYCNGVETCGDLICEKVEEPCRIGAFACVSSRCVEEMKTCMVAVDHGQCAPIVRPDGSMTPTYCDPATGCAPGKACYNDDECQDTSFCNGRERCVTGRCIGGLPPDITDDDMCNVDACAEPEGEVHFPDPASDGRPCLDANISGNAICLNSVCSPSVCGDLVVDSRAEDCEDENTNPSDACHQCRATLWNPEVIAGLGEGSGDPLGVSMNFPYSIAVTARGDIYVAELFGARVLRIDAANISTVFAGTGREGYSGDFGPAIAAEIGLPRSIAVDGDNNVFVLDGLHAVVRRIDGQSGIITTVAGGGTESPFVDQAAASTMFDDPLAIAVDGLGDLFVGDAGFQQIYRISMESGLITEEIFVLEEPTAITVDSEGALWVVDQGSAYVGRLDAQGALEDLVDLTDVIIPTGIAVSRDGRVFISSEGDKKIIEVDLETMEPIDYAGTGSGGSSGDGGPALSAAFAPTGIAVNFDGDLIIADASEQRLRRVKAIDGIIETIAGTGIRGPSLEDVAATSLPFLSFIGGVAVAPNGTVYASEISKGLVLAVDTQKRTITVVAGADTPLQPTALALDAQGALYIADDRQVRKRDAITGVLSTVAGNGMQGTCADNTAATGACFGAVTSLAFDGLGRLYVSDNLAGRINRINLQSNTIVRVADGLASPEGMAIDGSGDLYFAERLAHRVRKLNVASGMDSVIAGTGAPGFNGDARTATTAELSSPVAVAIDQLGRVLISDRDNERVRRIEANGRIITLAGIGVRGTGGDGATSYASELYSPTALAVGTSNEVFVVTSGTLYGAVRRIDATTQMITTYTGAVDPEGDGKLDRSRLGAAFGLALIEGTADRPIWWVADGGTGRVRQVDTGSGIVSSVAGYPFGTAGEGGLARYADLFVNPAGIAYDSAGRFIFVSELGGHVISRIDLNANPPTIRTYAGQSGVARHIDGSLAQSRFFGPAGLAFDPLTKQLYIADSGNHVVRVIDTGSMTPAVRTIAGTPGVRGFAGDGADAIDALFDTPLGIALGFDGSVYVADSGNHRVRRIQLSGDIETILGDGEPATSGNGSPARYFPVKSPSGLVVDRFGNLFVTSPETIRRVASGDDRVATGDDEVTTIFGIPPRTRFPDSVSHCLTGLSLIEGRGSENAADLWVLDACQGFLIRLERKLN